MEILHKKFCANKGDIPQLYQGHPLTSASPPHLFHLLHLVYIIDPLFFRRSR